MAEKSHPTLKEVVFSARSAVCESQFCNAAKPCLSIAWILKKTWAARSAIVLDDACGEAFNVEKQSSGADAAVSSSSIRMRIAESSAAGKSPCDPEERRRPDAAWASRRCWCACAAALFAAERSRAARRNRSSACFCGCVGDDCSWVFGLSNRRAMLTTAFSRRASANSATPCVATPAVGDLFDPKNDAASEGAGGAGASFCKSGVSTSKSGTKRHNSSPNLASSSSCSLTAPPEADTSKAFQAWRQSWGRSASKLDCDCDCVDCDCDCVDCVCDDAAPRASFATVRVRTPSTTFMEALTLTRSPLYVDVLDTRTMVKSKSRPASALMGFRFELPSCSACAKTAAAPDIKD
mmetsp:Transcript_19555/g.66100  ORF Transcript_19555/g.66100 Transcript_19555/m.66100 type:complete len:351 (-) Transcript_19555:3173-4225(-)